MLRRHTISAALIAGTLLTGLHPAAAASLRWANDGDANSMDPYTRSETFLLTFTQNIYDPLVRRDRELKVEPALAERWEQPDDRTWRFHLRHGVKFQGGEPFTEAADLTKATENFATRNANGTGPFILGVREPDRRTTLRNNPDWWDKPQHNLTEVTFNVIGNAATRVAALLSGDVDMIYSVPPQDMDRLSRTQGVKLLVSPELRKGKNPFQDRRVRQAFFQAIDTNAIKQRVMRNQSRPTSLMYGPGVNGFTEASDARLPYDPEASKKLLAEAGYPNGFGVTLDCPNDRYVNDEAICQAVTAMLARANIKITLAAQTRLKYFAEISTPDYRTSF